MSRKEKWKDIEGFTTYQVSSLGRVRRKAIQKTTTTGIMRKYPTKLLSPRKNKNSGLLCVSIVSDSGNTRTVYVHKMVAESFVENQTPRKRKWVCHLDGNLNNNKAINLKWVSKSESLHIRYKNSSNEQRKKQGRRDPLNEELLQKALLIRKNTGKSWQKIAIEIGCSASHLWKRIKALEGSK